MLVHPWQILRQSIAETQSRAKKYETFPLIIVMDNFNLFIFKLNFSQGPKSFITKTNNLELHKVIEFIARCWSFKVKYVYVNIRFTIKLFKCFKNNLERLMNMNLYLVIALVISVFFNVILCIQLAKYKTNRSTNINWKERMGLNNPFTAIVWAFLFITIFLSLMILIGGINTL